MPKATKKSAPVVTAPKKPDAAVAPTAPTAAEMRRISRLGRIARALMDGEKITAIAKAEGIERSRVHKLLASDESRQIWAHFVNQELEQLEGLYYRALRALEQGLASRKEYMDKDGCIHQGGPDNYARLASAKLLRDFLISGRPAAVKLEEKTENRTITYGELEQMMQERAEKEGL